MTDETGTSVGPDPNALRSEFYLCLARAFEPPTWPGAAAALREALPADLQDLGQQLGYPVDAPLAQYRQAIAGVDDLSLLQCYSRHFLTPPVPARINACFYLDGALMGGSVDRLLDWYRRAGVQPRQDFHDLPDHIAMQLEFVAHLYQRSTASEHAPGCSAAQFLRQFVARWVGPLLDDLAEEPGQPPSPYRHLARVLAIAVERDSGGADDDAAEPSESGPGISDERAQRHLAPGRLAAAFRPTRDAPASA